MKEPKDLHKKNVIQVLMNFLQKTIPSKYMIVLYRNYSLKCLKLKRTLLPKT